MELLIASLFNLFTFLHTGTAMVVRLGITYDCTMCTSHHDLVALAFYAIPILHILIFPYLSTLILKLI